MSVVEISVPAERRDTTATLTLTVDRAPVDQNEANESELTGQRYNESAAAWEPLETEVVSSGEDVVVLHAEPPGSRIQSSQPRRRTASPGLRRSGRNWRPPSREAL